MVEPVMTPVLCLKCEHRFEADTDKILEHNFRCPQCKKRHFSFPDEPEYTVRDPDGHDIKVRLVNKKKSYMQFIQRREEDHFLKGGEEADAG